MARSTMAALIARLRGYLGDDTVLTNDRLQELLDDHAFAVSAPLVHIDDEYTAFKAPYGNLEAGAAVFAGGRVYVVDTDYAIDLQTGVVGFAAPAATQVYIRARAYDLNASAADGWDVIAARHVGAYDHSANGTSARSSQKYDQAVMQADRYRRRTLVRSIVVDRADSDPHPTTPDVLDDFRGGFQ